MVKVKQKPNETSLVFTYGLPAPLLAMGCSLIVGYLILFVMLIPGQKEMEEEVRRFIETSRELNGAWQHYPAFGASSPRIGMLARTCSSCGAPLTENASFCQMCGAPVTIVQTEAVPLCASCGATLDANWRFCQGCGAPVAQAGPGA
jgi:hypothetical protein